MALYRPATLLPPFSRTVRAQPSGAYLSALKGRGMEYDESRPYQAGDDVRTLDWRVTARTGRPHTKVFREERERPVYLCVDFCPSMFFATRGVFKTVQASRAAALIAWKAQQSGDRVGGIVFSAGTHKELPPERGKPGVMRFVKLLVDAGRFEQPPPSAQTAAPFAGAIARLKRIARPGSLIFVVSDFRAASEATANDFIHLARHNDLTLVSVYDPLEAALPATTGNARVTDGRGGDMEIRLGDPARAHDYASGFEHRREQLRRLSRDHRMLYAELSTVDEPLPILQRMLGR